MQLPTVDRTPNLRSAAGVASPAVGKVIPLAPVNPAVASATRAEASPSVIDMVNPALKTNEGERVYTSVSDPIRPGTEAASTPRDWTIHRPVSVKTEDPPPKPLSQVLMDHLRTVWTASASAIQLDHVRDRIETPVAASASNSVGTLVKEALTYEPAKIKKNEKL